TRAAAHLPPNADELCLRAFFRIVHLINAFDIPPGLVINMDQTGITILMAMLKTYHKKGSRQVDIAARDEKRAYTLCVASTADGDVLPFQAVWSGSTKLSLPSRSADGMDEALEIGMDFTVAASDKKTSHFSTFKTMKEWVDNILKPWVDTYIETHQLPDDQKSVLFIDCYPVHIGTEFRGFLIITATTHR
ncbi:hypothetical protein BDZ89DRAFT_974879, partial [Hymenopellis radicata]